MTGLGEIKEKPNPRDPDMLPIGFLISAFLGIMLFASLASRRARLPYTLVLVFMGIALAAISNWTSIGGNLVQGTIAQIKSFNDQLVAGPGGGLFVALVVPPLIFEALMHVKSKELRDVIRPSFALATVGVVIATMVGGFVLWNLAGLPFLVSFLFAALISPTDVATVLEIFRRAKVPSRLAALMDTEAAFNDATGIVVFTIILTSFTVSVTRLPILQSMINFLLIFGGGVVVGAVVAFCAELLTSLIMDRISETILTIAAVYGSYALATALDFSGLISVAVVGLYFGNYTINKAVAPTTRETVNAFWQIAAFVGNSVAFLFIGLRTDIIKLSGAVDFIASAYLAVVLARFASVYPILSIFNRFARTKIPLKWQNVAMLGGARGALSIALAASIPVSALISKGDIDTISTMVLGVAFISISLQAGLLFQYIKRRFPEESGRAKEEEFNVRLSKAVAAIQAVQELKSSGKISDEEFADELEGEKNELEQVIAEIQYDVDTTNILKSRATELYDALVEPIEYALGRSNGGREDRSKRHEDEEENSNRNGGS